jgi:hypothetical protein
VKWRSLDALEIYAWGQNSVGISKDTLLRLRIDNSSLVAVSLNRRLILLFINHIRLVSRILVLRTFLDLRVGDFVLSVAFLKYGMVDLRLTNLHNSCRRSYFLEFTSLGALSHFIVINCLLRLATAWKLWWWFYGNILVLIRGLKSVTHNTLFPGKFLGFRRWCFAFVQTFTTIFPKSLFWGLPFNWLIIIFEIRKQKSVFLHIVKVQLVQEILKVDRFLLDFHKEFLGMRTSLRACSSTHMLLDSSPFLSE